MDFYSYSFLLFFVVFFILHWTIFNKNLKTQNIFLLLGSYFFYCWVDWRLSVFLLSSSLINFLIGIYINKNKKYKKHLVFIALIHGIGSLFFFKYYNFFISSFSNLFECLNISSSLNTLNLLIPIGISYYTFKTIGYILDVKNNKIKATTNWIVFFNYVAFFPTILSGPIDKAKDFLPQLKKQRVFVLEKASDGLRQILWGLFKKVVIANNIAPFTDSIFENFTELPSSTLLLGAFLYTIQLYADFSGYSDMAIGFSRLIGFNVTQNFSFPFYSQNIAEFWRKWHMSLTNWLTEYVFTPLSIQFRYYGKTGLGLSILINFTIIGVWHGANWTYIFFGFLHGCYFIPLIISGKLNKRKTISSKKYFPSLIDSLKMLTTFLLVMFSFVIFKAKSLSLAFDYFYNLFSTSIFIRPYILEKETGNSIFPATTLLLIFILLIIEWFSRDKQHVLSNLELKIPMYLRHVLYYLILITIIWFSTKEQQFIYLKF